MTKLSREERITLCHSLAQMVGGRRDLPSWAKAQAQQVKSPRVRNLLVQWANELSAGRTWPEILDDASDRLPSQLKGAIEAGQKSGRLADTLLQYAQMELLQWNDRNTIVRSLTVAAVSAGVSVALLVIVLAWLVPQQENTWKSFGIRLPEVVLIVLELSRITRWLLPLAGCLLAVTLLLILLGGRWFRFGIIDSVPVLGTMNLLTNERHVLEMLALLVERQVPLAIGVRLASEMSVDPFIRQRALELADDIEQGKPGWFRTHRHWVGAELLHQASTPEMLSERLRIVITMLQMRLDECRRTMLMTIPALMTGFAVMIAASTAMIILLPSLQLIMALSQ